MKEGQWKRDETPYLVFQCIKCQQYSYVKTTQKTKKCLRCNRNHQVLNILGRGEIVKGMTAALNRVKELQNELSHKQLGSNPNLTTQNGFSIPSSQSGSISNYLKGPKLTDENDSYLAFLSLLIDLSNSYKEFPYHLIEILADSYGISKSAVASLVGKALREGSLKKREELYSI